MIVGIIIILPTCGYTGSLGGAVSRVPGRVISRVILMSSFDSSSALGVTGRYHVRRVMGRGGGLKCNTGRGAYCSGTLRLGTSVMVVLRPSCRCSPHLVASLVEGVRRKTSVILTSHVVGNFRTMEGNVPLCGCCYGEVLAGFRGFYFRGRLSRCRANCETCEGGMLISVGCRSFSGSFVFSGRVVVTTFSGKCRVRRVCYPTECSGLSSSVGLLHSAGCKFRVMCCAVGRLLGKGWCKTMLCVHDSSYVFVPPVFS